MLLRLAGLAAGASALLALAACANRTYPTSMSDSSYDLAAMALTNADLPPGLTVAVISPHSYDNAAWVAALRNAQILSTSNSAQSQTQAFNRAGRIRNWVSVYQPTGLQRVIGLTTVSTLYKDIPAAQAGMSKGLCGLPLSGSEPMSALEIPQMADGSTGFETVGQGGLVDSTLCFRTGRVVNAVQETNVPGTEDFALLVQLGQRMLTRVNGVFDGKLTATAIATPPASTATPAISTPSASGTATTAPTQLTPAVGTGTATPSNG